MSARSHFARFAIVDDNLLHVQLLRRRLPHYIRDFIVTVGDAFDAMLARSRTRRSRPCRQHLDEFIDWVHRHDLYQLPDD